METLSPAGVGSPTGPPPPPAQDISTMTDMVTELTRPVDRAQLNQEIEDFNLSFPVNVDDALNAFTLPPVAGTGTAPPITTSTPITTTTAPPPITTAPTTTTASSRRPRPRPVTSTRTPPQCRSWHQDYHLHGYHPHWTSYGGCQTTATPSPGTLSSVPSTVGR